MKKLFYAFITLLLVSVEPSNAQIGWLVGAAVNKIQKKKILNQTDPNKPNNIKENSITYFQSGNIKGCTIYLAKSGKLKSLIKENSDINKVIIHGIINEKDIETLKSFPHLKTLDLTNVCNSELSFNSFNLDKIKTNCSIDTLYIPQVIKLQCAESQYWNILPCYVVSEGIAYINSGFSNRKDFSDIQGFPQSSGKSKFYVPDTLDLTSAIIVDDFFEGQKMHFHKVAFGKNIRLIKHNAFNIDGIDILEFSDGSNPIIEYKAFNPKGDVHNPHDFQKLPNIKMARIPKGLFDYFLKSDFPPKILVESDPTLGYNVVIRTPGTLEQTLHGINLKEIIKLKISGTLDFQDINTLRSVYFLKYLDLSDAVVCMSEADRQNNLSKLEGQYLMANLMSEAQYQRDRNRFGKNVRDKFLKAGEEAIEDKKKEKLPNICEIPGGAFFGLDLLQELALPKTLENIGTDRYRELITSKNMSKIWVSKEAYPKLPLEWIRSISNAEIKTY